MTDNKPVTIRQETAKDFPQVFAVIERAFRGEAYSDHKEQFLVERPGDGRLAGLGPRCGKA